MALRIVNRAPELCNRLLNYLPTNHVTFCFAYGSGVVKQTGSDISANMIDLILAVDNTSEWHRQNLLMNPSHYSSLKHLGHSMLSKIQKNLGASIYFNTLIPIEEEKCLIKYGIISHNDLIIDLLDWSDLYVAGRLHKPVQIVKQSSSPELTTALQLNLQSAVHTALLMLPEHFTEVEFYKTIASLSYMGDFRTLFGEDKNKLNNIVHGQVLKFRKLYDPALKTLSDYVEFPPTCEAENEKLVHDGEKCCRQDTSPAAKHYHLNQLPRTPQRSLVKYWNISTKKRLDTEDVLHAVAYDPDCPLFIKQVIISIVWTKSITQSLKGIMTAGVIKSLKYSTRKLKKMIKSMQ